MAQVICKRCAKQAQAHRYRTAAAYRNNSLQQQARERLELQALALGADHVLSQLAADAWLREVGQ